jgi:hypothetical protein
LTIVLVFHVVKTEYDPAVFEPRIIHQVSAVDAFEKNRFIIFEQSFEQLTIRS